MIASRLPLILLLMLPLLTLSALPERFVFRTTVTGSPASFELVSGTASQAWPERLKQGDRLLVIRHGATVSLLQNGHLVGDLPAAGLTEIRPGGKVETGRLQRSGAIVFGDDFMRSDNDLGLWTAASGDWRLDTIPNPTWSANAFRLRADGDGLLSAGYWFWHDIAIRAALRPSAESQGAGIALGIGGEQGLLWRWRAPDHLELVQLDGNRETVLHSVRRAYDPTQWNEWCLLVSGQRALAYLDDELIAEVKLDMVPIGKVGLWSLGGERAVFDDVAVHSLPPELPPATDGPAMARAIFGPDRVVVPQRMATDSYMLGWSTQQIDWNEWERRGDRHWCDFVGVLGDQWELTWDTPPPKAELRLRDTDGQTVTLSLDVQTLSLQDNEHEPSTIPRPDGPLTWRREGDRLTLSNGGETLVTVPQLALGMSRLSLGVSNPKTVTLPAMASPSIHDYTFYTAPVDWRVASGTWEITSRWTCTPDWSWFGGVGDQAAAIWSKKTFTGDQVAEFYSAVMMTYGNHGADMPFGYRRRGELNVTICGDGRDLSSGYTLMFGGYDNSRTCLWRGDRIVAERDDRLYPMKKGRHLHKSWFNVRLEKRGSRIIAYVDDEPVLEYDDPNPLPGGQVAFWTWDSGIMVPRARVFGNGKVTPAAEAPAIRQPVHSTQQDGVRTFTNLQTGGTLRTPLTEAPINVREQGRLRFACKLPPAAKLHLYLRANGHNFYLAMTAPETDQRIQEGATLAGISVAAKSNTGRTQRPLRLGALQVAADNSWQTIDVDLAELLQPWFPAGEAITIQDLYLGNWSNQDYLMCGFGGNTYGLSWQVKDVSFAPSTAPTSPPLAGEWRVASEDPLRLVPGSNDVLTIGAGPSGGRLILLDHVVDTVRFPRLTLDYRSDTPLQLAVRKQGEWRELPAELKPGKDWQSISRSLHDIKSHIPFIDAVALIIAEDTATPLREIQLRGQHLEPGELEADTQPPVLSSCVPEDGAITAASNLRVRLEEEGSGIDIGSLRLTIGETQLTLADPSMNYNAYAGLLEVPLPYLPADGESVRCRLEAADRTGNAMTPATWSWTMRYADDRLAPDAPYVAYIPSQRLVWDSFETDLGEWQPRRGGWAIASTQTAATGTHSCEVHGFSTFARYTPFNAQMFPIVQLDYRFQPSTACNIAFMVNNHNFELQLDKRRNKYQLIGELEGIKTDDKWHRLSFDLLELFADYLVEGEPLLVQEISIIRNRRQPDGAWLDNFVLASRQETAPQFEWSVPADMTGIRGYSIAFDQNAYTQPDTTINTTDTAWQTEAVEPGTWYLHVRACDGAGNWSTTSRAEVSIP